MVFSRVWTDFDWISIDLLCHFYGELTSYVHNSQANTPYLLEIASKSRIVAMSVITITQCFTCNTQVRLECRTMSLLNFTCLAPLLVATGLQIARIFLTAAKFLFYAVQKYRLIKLNIFPCYQYKSLKHIKLCGASIVRASKCRVLSFGCVIEQMEFITRFHKNCLIDRKINRGRSILTIISRYTHSMMIQKLWVVLSNKTRLNIRKL